MKHIHISGPTAINAMIEAVKERGEDFVYSTRFGEMGCEYLAYPDGYAEEKVPACLVGVALMKIDPDLRPWLEYNNSDNVWGMTGQANWFSYDGLTVEEIVMRVDGFDGEVAPGVRLTMDKEAVAALGLAQGQQDKDFAWGVSLRYAQEALS